MKIKIIIIIKKRITSSFTILAATPKRFNALLYLTIFKARKILKILNDLNDLKSNPKFK